MYTNQSSCIRLVAGYRASGSGKVRWSKRRCGDVRVPKEQGRSTQVVRPVRHAASRTPHGAVMPCGVELLLRNKAQGRRRGHTNSEKARRTSLSRLVLFLPHLIIDPPNSRRPPDTSSHQQVWITTLLVKDRLFTRSGTCAHTTTLDSICLVLTQMRVALITSAGLLGLSSVASLPISTLDAVSAASLISISLY